MRKVCLILVLISLFLIPGTAMAWGGKGGWHQLQDKEEEKKAEKTYSAPAPAAQPPEHRHVVSAVSYYTQFRSSGGYYYLDGPDGQTWFLKVAYAPRVEKIDDNTYQVFGNFKGRQGQSGPMTPVVVKFDLTGAEQTWTVKGARIHSVDGSEV